MNKEELGKKIKLKFPNEEYKILRYGVNSNDTTELKCLICGRHIIVNTGELLRKRRKHICSKCYYKRIDTEHNEQIVIKKFESWGINNYKFYMRPQPNGIRVHCVQVQCNKCQKISDYRVVDVLKYQTLKCQYCEGAKKKKDNDIFLLELGKASQDFDILEGYTDSQTSIKVRCNHCGFIRSVKPTTFLKHLYCPKCGKTKSIGEKKIIDILNELNIKFETQKYFREWNSGLHYYDFYIPQYHLVLEYMGSQHYNYNNFFYNSLSNFNYRKNKDIEKKKIALEHNLNYCSISYINLDNLKFILLKLFDSTTIPEGSRPKWVEIETIFNEDEDIVWTYVKA